MCIGVHFCVVAQGQLVRYNVSKERSFVFILFLKCKWSFISAMVTDCVEELLPDLRRIAFACVFLCECWQFTYPETQLHAVSR